MKFKPFSILYGVLIVLCLLSLATEEGKHSEEPWHLTNVTGYLPDLHFLLTDDNGKNVTEQSYKGYVVLLYFGFTHCPDECPVTMARIAALLHKMGSNADKIRVLFVSIDPTHDTPGALHEYLKSFDAKHMVGLTGQEKTISEMAKRYRAAFQKDDKGNVGHSNGIYIFDAEGHARLLASDSDSDQNIHTDLEHLIAP